MTRSNPKFDRDFSILILAGGRGQRMGGRDKGLLPVAGAPAIEHLLARLRSLEKPVLISANRNLERYAAYGYPVVEDTFAHFPGPLAGMLAGLAACHSDWLLVLPVDTPLVGAEYASRMLECTQREPVQACVAECGGKLEPVFCLLHRSLHDSLREFLNSGQRSVRDWMALIGARRVDFSDLPDQFTNMNREADLHELETRLRARKDDA